MLSREERIQGLLAERHFQLPACYEEEVVDAGAGELV